ncbi:MAG: glycoside hydrolase family 2 [Clostridia bacterium]|nr:glycoside hydrolase family 2 [Clostridia bacterium]
MVRLKSDYEVGEIPLSEYPRPQMRRESYLCLNGVWRYQKVKGGEQIQGEWKNILVPFSPESLNSGVEEGFTLGRGETLVYEREFIATKEFLKGATMLHFGAVDQICEVFLNGVCVCAHDSGFTPFCIDVTAAIKEGENLLRVECVDETEATERVRGKQSTRPGTIWYTAQSGIWQTVWLESAPEKYIKSIRITPDAEKRSVFVASEYEGKQKITVYDGEAVLVEKEFSGGQVSVESDFQLWSPENPKLYDFVLETDSGDKIFSYFGVRSFSVQADKNGKKRLCLNGKPYFMNGVLDQGYWSDGLLTPPSYQAVYDELKMLKEMGFNMVRKHIKVEPLVWYHYCDKLGLLVWQDFVNGGGEYKFTHVALLPFLGIHHKDDDYRYFARENTEARYEYIHAAQDTVNALYNCPCISTWVPFNEGWGQFDSEKISYMVLEMDGTRFIDSVSGWHDQGREATAMRSLHTYYMPLKVPRDPRPVVLSEFGGYSKKTDGHIYNTEKEFGYKVFKTNEALLAGLKKLFLKKLKPLIAKGLCASVYTQVSDVEEEINGLVTYDRKVIKVPVAEMRAINDEIKAESEKVE